MEAHLKIPLAFPFRIPLDSLPFGRSAPLGNARRPARTLTEENMSLVSETASGVVDIQRVIDRRGGRE